MTETKLTPLWRIAVGISLVLLVLAGVGTVHAEAIGGFVVPGSKAATLDQCVEPTGEMRHYHMEYIRHQRNTTVYNGIRHTKFSLSGCVSCHAAHDAQGTPIPINGKGQFCNACHEKAAVTLNCFDCHATVPTGESWNQVTNPPPSTSAQPAASLDRPAPERPAGRELVQVPDMAEQEEFQKR